MDINKKPVYKVGSDIKFVNSCSDKKIKSQVSIFDLNGNELLSKTINCNQSIDVSKYLKNKVSVKVKYLDNLISRYSFYIYNEPEGDEFSSVPFAKIFLKKLAENNDGDFIETNDIKDIKKVRTNTFYTEIESSEVILNIFELKYLLLILLFLLVLSYYLKSRYMS